MDKATEAFYLKVNRNNSYTIPNLKHWIDAASLVKNADIFILCDNEELKEKIESSINYDKNRVAFLESDRQCKAINFILENVCTEKWMKVGQAHLTTHWHANKNQYSSFWNIDADDTFICLDAVRISEMFKYVEQYSKKQRIAMNSLDMWYSCSVNEKWNPDWQPGAHWSFGITFVDNNIEWEKLLLEHCHDKETMIWNLDWYFTYLRNIGAERFESFYFENMRFAHFYDYFLNFPHQSSFCHWKNGTIYYPILKECFSTHFMGEYEIAGDVLKFDMGITDDESLISLLAFSQEKSEFYRELRNPDLEIGHVMKKKCELFLQGKNKKILVFWGAGMNFQKQYELIMKAYDLKYVCDNNSEKWGKKLIGDVVCISPQQLRNMQDVFVVTIVKNMGVQNDIEHQLIDMGITDFESFENWYDEMEGVV
jgi:hypothetical protein